MNLSDYFNTPEVSASPCLIKPEHSFKQQLVAFKTDKINADVALIGVHEDGNSLYNKGCAEAPDKVRRYLYNLQGAFQNLYVSDLGNLKKGKGLNDTYFALQDVVDYLLEQRVIPIIIGGSHDLVYPVSKAMAEKISSFNLAVADSAVDALSEDELHDHSFLAHLTKVCHHISVCGVQGYQSDTPSEFELLRLKTIRDDLYTTEPILRDAHFTAFDMAVVKAADMPGSAYASPNGLQAEQFCKLAHYAGLSDAVKAFGLFGLNSTLDTANMGAKLAAQAIWHFIFGLDNRFKDYPLRDISTYNKKLVYQEDIKRELVFYHNLANNRYWFNAATDDAPEIVSCTMDDYLATQDGQLPDRLMWFLRG